MKKFILTNETIEIFGITLHRIKAVRSFGNVKEGDFGGFIEKEENLSQELDAWVYGNAKVWGNAKVCDDAQVLGYAKVCGNAQLCGNAQVCNNADYIVFKNWWSSGRYFTWTRSNNMWSVGCFCGTGEELIKKAYEDSEKSGREYERVVNFVQSILEDKQ